MKKNWQAPRIQVQEFEANEYVAACYSLYCAIAGDGKGKYKGDIVPFNQNKYNWGNFSEIKADGLWHGRACAEGSSYSQELGLFYEVGKPGSKVDSSTIELGDNAGDGYQYATWVSIDGATGDRYTHYGYAKADDGSRPNHS